jgi:iron(III) transport system permease protein
VQATLRFPRPLVGRLPIVSPLLLVAVAPIAVIVLFVGVLVWVSVQRGTIGTAGATYTLENYTALFGDPFVLRVVLNTAVFAAMATLVSLAIGLPIAWLAERTTMRGKALIYAIMTLGLLIPGIYTAMGWTFIAHPRIGLLNQWLMGAFGLTDAPIDIATPVGMGFIQGLSLASLGFVLTVQMFRAMNPSLEEASQVHGMGFATTMRRITLPLAKPGILAAVIYIVTIGIATFDIPAIIGLGNRVYMLSTYIYVKANPSGAGTPEHGITATAGVFMIVVAVALTLWYGQVLREGHRYQVVTGKGYRPTPVKLGRWEIGAWGFIALYALAAKVLPFVLLAYVAFTPYLAAPSADMLSQLSTAQFERIDWSLVLRGLRNTALLMLVVPLAVLLFGFCISWLVVRSRTRARYLLEFVAFLPHALPEVILAIGALLMALFVVKGWLPLYGSVWLIAIVYVIARLAFATRALNGSLLQIHRELEEAAYAAGLSTARTAWRIMLPLLRPTLLSVWIWTALLVYRELTVAVFLSSQDSITLPAVVWSYWFSGNRNLAAAVTLVMTVALVPLIGIFWWYGRRSQVTTQ